VNIPYYRYVRDADDGCGIDQCLNCGATWEWRGGSGKVKYCMYCGVKFRNELHCRDRETPRWMYEYRQRHGDEALHKLERRWWDHQCSQPGPSWVLEEQTILLKSDGRDDHILADWHKKRCLTQDVSAHDAYKSLLAARREDSGDDSSDDPYDFSVRQFARYEYRVRRYVVRFP